MPVDGFELFDRHVASKLRALSYIPTVRDWLSCKSFLMQPNQIFNAAQSDF